MDAELQELGRRLVGHWTTEATHPEDQTMSGKGQLSYDDTLRLTEAVTYPNGTLHLAYETAGAPTYGDMTIEERDRHVPAGDD